MAESRNLKPGDELPPFRGQISLQQMIRYESWHTERNIHNDPEIAREIGLPTPIPRAVMLSSFIYRMLQNTFGSHWLVRSKLSLNFLKPVNPGETITARGQVSEKNENASGHSYVVDVQVERENKELAAAGKAYLNVGP